MTTQQYSEMPSSYALKQKLTREQQQQLNEIDYTYVVHPQQYYL